MRPVLFGEAYRISYQPVKKPKAGGKEDLWIEQERYLRKQLVNAVRHAGVQDATCWNHDGTDYLVFDGPKAKTLSQLKAADRKFATPADADLQTLGKAYLAMRDYVWEKGIIPIPPDGNLNLQYRISDETGGIHLENKDALVAQIQQKH